MSTTLRREWIEIAAVSVVSFVLYQFNVVVLFLVPLQIAFVRRGARALFASSGLVFAAVAVSAVVRLARVDDADLRRVLTAVEIAVPLFLIGGVVLTDVELPSIVAAGRKLRLGVVTVVAGLLSVPIVGLISRNKGLESFFLQQIEAVGSAIRYSASGDSTLEYALAEILGDPRRLAETISRIMLQTYLFAFCVLVGMSVWLGDFAAAKTLGTKHRRIWSFHLSERALWIFLFGWGVVLLDIAIGIGAAGYFGWNVGLIMLFAYGVQGASIIRHLLVRRGVSGALRVFIGVALILLLFWPVANLLVIIGIPGLGISETWIHYRRSVKE